MKSKGLTEVSESITSLKNERFPILKLQSIESPEPGVAKLFRISVARSSRVKCLQELKKDFIIFKANKLEKIQSLEAKRKMATLKRLVV